MSLLSSNFFFHFHFFHLFFLLNIFTSRLTFQQAFLQLSKLIFLFPEYSLRFLLNFPFLFLKCLFLNSFLFEIELILCKIPIKFSLIPFVSWLCLRYNNNKHMISTNTNPIKMKNLLSLHQAITIQINITIFTSINSINIILIFLFYYCCMIYSYTHATDLYIIWGLSITFTDFCYLTIDLVVYTTT